ncbi:MAG: helix-turn-helix transcriptional regulator [Magnetovibrio sp.]|nr:helix-turn-helix transcriptional regulator [Magnetovibrio sp.]
MPAKSNARKAEQHPLLGTPRPVDIHVGARLRQRRTLLGMSQEKLGEAVGLTFQQIQKYERGANRIGASRLYQLGQVLDVSVSYFFEEMPGEVQKTRGDYAAPENSEKLESVQTSDPMARRETLELVRAYYRIEDPKVRKRVFELTKSIANATDSNT